jgi:hypothetical protein
MKHLVLQIADMSGKHCLAQNSCPRVSLHNILALLTTLQLNQSLLLIHRRLGFISVLLRGVERTLPTTLAITVRLVTNCP